MSGARLRMPRLKKVKPPLVLNIPPANPNITSWVILGLDPSVSRTGFALQGVYKNAEGPSIEEWLTVGSARPDKLDGDAHTRTTLWARSKAIALFIRELVKLLPPISRGTGLIISTEYPTPQNDFLVALNRILHVVLFEDGYLENMFSEIHVLTTNASTLRSLMGLKQRGATNKKENIEKAYTFIDQKKYPELDSDSCDAVLMAMMGRHVASILLGKPDEVPPAFITSLCNATVEIKGKGRNAHSVIKGSLHRKEYWYPYKRQDYGVGIKDASNPKKALTRKYFSI